MRAEETLRRILEEKPLYEFFVAPGEVSAAPAPVGGR